MLLFFRCSKKLIAEISREFRNSFYFWNSKSLCFNFLRIIDTDFGIRGVHVFLIRK